jgi:hypothetical protein
MQLKKQDAKRTTGAKRTTDVKRTRGMNKKKGYIERSRPCKGNTKGYNPRFSQ